jgi:hypothetical protein
MVTCAVQDFTTLSETSQNKSRHDCATSFDAQHITPQSFQYRKIVPLDWDSNQIV